MYPGRSKSKFGGVCGKLLVSIGAAVVLEVVTGLKAFSHSKSCCSLSPVLTETSGKSHADEICRLAELLAGKLFVLSTSTS